MLQPITQMRTYFLHTVKLDNLGRETLDTLTLRIYSNSQPRILNQFVSGNAIFSHESGVENTYNIISGENNSVVLQPHASQINNPYYITLYPAMQRVHQADNPNFFILLDLAVGQDLKINFGDRANENDGKVRIRSIHQQ